MIAALGTLPFLAALWLFLVLGARTLEESGAKIAAALKGESQHTQPQVRLRARVRWQAQQVSRAEIPPRVSA